MLPLAGTKDEKSNINKEKPVLLLFQKKIKYCIPINLQTYTSALMNAIVSPKYTSLHRSEIPIATG